MRWREIKRLFSKGYLEQIGPGEVRNESRIKQGEAAIWQRRFWEHTIRNQEDLNRHVDYIHFNPVKHGLVKNVSDWPWSSFHRFVIMGHYDRSWGEGIEKTLGVIKAGE
jgi:putative transposase